MAIAKADVLLIAPELSAVDDARFGAAIADAELQVNTGALGTRSDLAKRYLVAHLLSLSQSMSQGHGLITSETVGSISRTYESVAQAEGSGGTRYWNEYSRIIRSAVAGPRVA